MTSSEPPMKPAPPAKTEDPPPGDQPRAQGPLPFDQVLRRLLDAKTRKTTPKPGKPPRKL